MRKVIFIITVFSLYILSGNSQTDWQVLNSGVTVNLNGLYFTSLNTGYVCGSSATIIKTTNGGLNWSALVTPASGTLYDICFFNTTTGYCCGYSGIIKTTNEGLTWTNIYDSSETYKIFCTPNFIYAATYNHVIKSSNAGVSWNNVYTVSGWKGGVFFNNNDTGYVMGNNALTLKTINGGINWYISGPWIPGTYSFGECHFFNSGTGYTAYSYYSGPPFYTTSYGIYKTQYWTSSGWSWTLIYNSSFGIGGLTFAGNDTGYAVGGGFQSPGYHSLIVKTTNGGAGWFQQNFVYNQVLNDVFFLNSKTGYVAGDNGTIIKTLNGGVIKIKNISSEVQAQFSLSQNHPNPFNPSTHFEFRIAEFGYVKLSIFDVLGREVETLVNEQLKPGTYEVDWPACRSCGAGRDASNYSSGVYYYKLSYGNYSETKRMVLIK